MSQNGSVDRKVAIVGFAGMFPGAGDVNTFWRNLKDGKESLTEFSPEELRELGAPRVFIENPNAVAKAMVLDDVHEFDAEFFGYTDGQANAIDPQQRLFLQTCWHALEHAGYDIRRYEGRVGVYAGAAKAAAGDDSDSTGVQAEVDSGLGSIANRVSYKLNLRGPSIAVNTACSTSLMSVHLAVQSLICLECDMVLAGGISISLPQIGYIHHKHGILAPTGHCRPYDADACGTVPGSGVGVVVLKRLQDAVADRDRIFAVIRGSATNNDGNQKVGYTAPSLEAQVDVVETALSIAGVRARSIGLIEGHGTGTVLGDAIELAALNEVFLKEPGEPRRCALASVKANVGHLDVAAGVAGLIKVALCLSERTLVPQINYSRPNDTLLSPDSPFFVNDVLREWRSDGAPRRAAVTSLGIGGSNVHVVLEEFVSVAEPTVSAVAYNAFPLSARSAAALEKLRGNMLGYLQAHRELCMEDVAFTLQAGRCAFEHRQAIVAADMGALIAALAEGGKRSSSNRANELDRATFVLQFGDASALQWMSLEELYVGEPAFCEIVDSSLDSVAQVAPLEKAMLLRKSTAPATVAELRRALQVVLLREYCLSQLYAALGAAPDAVIGFGVGKLAAACMAEILSLEDACTLAAATVAPPECDDMPLERVIVEMPPSRVAEFSWLGVWLIPGAKSGTCEILAASSRMASIKRALGRESAEARTRGGRDESALQAAFERIALAPNRIRYLSCQSGDDVDSDLLVSPTFWLSQCEITIATSDEALGGAAEVALVVSGNHSARELHDLLPSCARHRVVLGSDAAGTVDRTHVLRALAAVWEYGGTVDWCAEYLAPVGMRVPLPVYPFETKRYASNFQGNMKQDAASSKSREESTELAMEITRIWEEVLGKAPIGPDDRFLTIGGDSLAAIQVLERVEALCGVEFPIEGLIKSEATIRTMVRGVSEAMAVAAAGQSITGAHDQDGRC